MIDVGRCTRRAMIGVAAAAAGAAVATSLAASLAHEPAARADPQSNTLCPEGARTSVPDGRLQCRAGTWQRRTDVDPAAQWLTYGPAVTLTGASRHNPDISAGTWLGQPQEPGTRCRAEQVLATDTLPEVIAGAPGQRITVTLSPALYSITLSGDCLWRRLD